MEQFEMTERQHPELQFRSDLVLKVDRTSDSVLRMTESSDANAPMSACQAMNRKYEFQLEKENDSNSWTLVSCELVNKPTSDSVTGGLSGSLHRPSVRQPFEDLPAVQTVANDVIVIARLREEPGFKLVSAVEDTAKGQIVIEFSHQVPKVWSFDGKRSSAGTARSTLTLDAQNCCLPIRFTQSLSAHAGERQNFLLTQENRVSDGRPSRTVTRIRRTFTDGTVVVGDREELVDTKYRYEEVREADFTLTAFGLPEPPGIEWEKEPIIRRFRAWGVALFIAVCCLMVVVGILRSQR
jgi:hypothetical protein